MQIFKTVDKSTKIQTFKIQLDEYQLSILIDALNKYPVGNVGAGHISNITTMATDMKICRDIFTPEHFYIGMRIKSEKTGKIWTMCTLPAMYKNKLINPIFSADNGNEKTSMITQKIIDGINEGSLTIQP